MTSHLQIYSYTREAYLDLVQNIKRIIPGRNLNTHTIVLKLK